MQKYHFFAAQVKDDYRWYFDFGKCIFKYQKVQFFAQNNDQNLCGSIVSKVTDQIELENTGISFQMVLGFCIAGMLWFVFYNSEHYNTM